MNSEAGRERDERSPETILVVDDTATNRLLLRALLQKEGYEVEEAENGIDCLERCKQNPPNAVLLDVMMPVMDGLTACIELRKSFSKDELPVIMVTTKIESADLAEGMAAGASDYVTKPIDRVVLLARLANQLQFARSQRELLEAKRGTERALSVQNAIGDSLPDAICVTDAEGTIVYANQHLYQACGSLSEQNIREVFLQIYDGRLRERFESAYREPISLPFFLVDEGIESLGGGFRHYHVISRVIDRGEDFLRVWVIRDDTRERKLERQINDELKMDMVGIFASGVAHNFNNIMGGIVASAEFLARPDVSPERRDKCSSIIQKAVSSGMQLTRRMSSIRKHDSRFGGNSSRVEEIVIEVCNRKREKHPEVSFEISESDVSVSLDRVALKDILTHLVDNAVDSLGGASGKVEIVVSASPGSRTAEIVVRDSGRGMGPDELARAFEPFYSTKNLDVANRVSVEGNGLGLFTVYNIAHAAGGDVTLDSTKGVGTTAVVTLPLKDDSVGA
ncbi:MAG: response regulator [Bdellovibrionales bacterium]|nr:response regulator [Bdellovibrionales bacterium]